MLNRIVIMGRLTRDPELRHTRNGTSVASFTLAVERDYAPKDGGEKGVDFIDCVAWQTTAEFASKYFSKGRMAVVSGRLQPRDWQDNNGNKRRAAEVIVDSMYFGDSKKDTGNQQNGGARSEAASDSYRARGYDVEYEDFDADDGDLPF